jgi:hypothetical protein
MNFGLALAAQRIPGVKIDLLALNGNHEPESSEAALSTYSRLIMPERDLSKTIARLTPLLNDPELTFKVAKAAEKATSPQPRPISMGSQNSTLAQVVGVIIGSPEFQRK